MRYLRTNGLWMLGALQPIAAELDACWWYLGGQGFQLTGEFLERCRARRLTDAQIDAYYDLLLSDYVDHGTPFGRVGKPGFFTRLGDAVDFSWACHFAIESEVIPDPSLRVVSEFDHLWFGPWDDLPSDVALVARDIDATYQDYGFRDTWMFLAVLDRLRDSGYPTEEITQWPNV